MIGVQGQELRGGRPERSGTEGRRRRSVAGHGRRHWREARARDASLLEAALERNEGGADRGCGGGGGGDERGDGTGLGLGRVRWAAGPIAELLLLFCMISKIGFKIYVIFFSRIRTIKPMPWLLGEGRVIFSSPVATHGLFC
jgi:hypothetical protein